MSLAAKPGVSIIGLLSTAEVHWVMQMAPNLWFWISGASQSIKFTWGSRSSCRHGREWVGISPFCKKEGKRWWGEGSGLPLNWPFCFSRTPGDAGKDRCPQVEITPCRVWSVPACQAKPTCQTNCEHGTSQSWQGIPLLPLVIDKKSNKKIGAEELCAVTFPFVRNVKAIPNSSL